MTTTFPTVQWNSRERALSNDMNQQARLVSRAITETATAIVSGTLRQMGVFGTSFLVAPVAGTMKCTINPGTALFVDGVSVYPDSTVQWMESSAIREITLEASDASSRYDVIEMRPGSVTTSTQPRDEFNPLTGTFTVVNMAKEVASYPEFQARKGVASATPSIPAGTAGWMPLAYVRVVGGALTLIATDVVHCRPILDAAPANGYSDPALVRSASKVRGGGLSAAGGSTTATLATGVSGRFPGAYHDFRVDSGAEAILNAMTIDSGVLPAASCALYFYAVPPPYPSGYSSAMAPRELWTPDVSMIYSGNGGFTNAARQDGCIIVGSEQTPSTSNTAGAPGVGGNATLNHTFFSSAPSSSARSKWVYIGAVSYDQGLGTFNGQTFAGGRVSTTTKPGTDYFALLPIAADTQMSVWSEPTGTTVVRWPVTARNVSVQFVATLAAAGYHNIGAVDSASTAAQEVGGHAYMLVGSTAGFVGHNADMVTSAIGEFTMKAATQVNATTAKVYGRHYQDSIIASR